MDRILPNPSVGRTVLYVLGDDEPCAGQIRPAIITRVNADSINLSVQLDGENDGAHEHRTQNTRWERNVTLSQDEHIGGSWHWMDYQIPLAVMDPPPLAPGAPGIPTDPEPQSLPQSPIVDGIPVDAPAG